MAVSALGARWQRAHARSCVQMRQRDRLRLPDQPGYSSLGGLHRLAGDVRDQRVIAVVVQNGDPFSFGHCRD